MIAMHVGDYLSTSPRNNGVPSLQQRLASVKHPEQILTLLGDRQRDGIVAQGRLLLYTDETGKQRSMNGLLPVLSSVFWPDDERGSRAAALDAAKARAKKDAQYRSQAAARSGVAVFGAPLASGGGGRPVKQQAHGLGGVARGSRVHAQLEDALLIDTASFANKYGSVAPEVKAILQFIENTHHVVPVLGEFPVAAPDLGIVVRHDMLGVRSDGTVVFYEFKTGFKNCFAAASGVPLAGALATALDDSERSRALIQLAASVLVTLRAYPYLQRFEAYVLRPSDTETGHMTCTELEFSFLEQYGPALYADLVRARKPTAPAASMTPSGLTWAPPLAQW